MKTLLDPVHVITRSAVIESGYVLFSEKGILRVGSAKAARPDADEILDGGNRFVAPGLIDLHNHGRHGHDCMDATEEAIETIAAHQLKHGVTAFLGTTMTQTKERLTAALNNAGRMTGPIKGGSELLGVYLEGPYFSPEKKGAQPLSEIRDPDIGELDALIEASGGTIRIVALAPERNHALETIRHLRGKGIHVAMGHTDATYEEAARAIEAGADMATHLFNGMRAFHHREPGVIGASLTSDEVYAELIVDGIHLHQKTVELAVRSKSPERIVLISDAMRAADMPNGEYDLGGQTVIMKDGTARLADGALAGSTLNLFDAVTRMVNTYGYDLPDVFRMASLNPARAIGVDDRFGEIAEGREADMIVFDDAFRLHQVIKAGEIHRLS